MIQRILTRLRWEAKHRANLAPWRRRFATEAWRDLVSQASALLDAAPADLAADPDYRDYLTIQLAAGADASDQERTDGLGRVRELVDRMLNYVPMSDRRAASTLVVGPRSGHELDALAEITGGHVEGLDLHTDGVDPRIKVGDMHRLPFAENCFDIVFACHALEYAFDFDLAVTELFRVLRPGGWLILEVEVGFEPDALRRHDAGTRDALSYDFQCRVNDPAVDHVFAVDDQLPQRVGDRDVKSLRLFVHLEAPPGAGALGVEPPAAPAEMHVMPPAGSLTVRLDITNKCNLECIHCSLDWTREALGEPKANLPVEDFARIAEQVFPYAAVVALSYEAEPMMHRDFLDILDIVKQYPGPGYVMTTNGTLMNEKRLDALFDCGLSHLNISFDGATKETFERIREKGRFERAIKGITMFRDRKRQLGLGRHDFPALQVNFTLMRSTLEELTQMVELCREWDVHQLTLQHLYGMPVNKLYDESLIHHKGRSDEVLQEARLLCEQYGIQTVFPRLFDPPSNLVQIGGGAAPQVVTVDDSATQPSTPAGEAPGHAAAPEADAAAAEGSTFYCLAPWRMLKIRWNGDLLPCDVWRDAPLGNLLEHGFEEIWKSPRYRTLRDGLAQNQPSHSSCIHCDTVTTDNLEGKEVSSPFAHTPRSNLRPASVP